MCCAPDAVVLVEIWRDAKVDARTVFRLASETEILAFIAGGGLEQPQYLSTEDLLLNRDPKNPIAVVSYAFVTGRKCGYIAFFRSAVEKRWTIKSFKENTDSALRARAARRRLPTTKH